MRQSLHYNTFHNSLQNLPNYCSQLLRKLNHFCTMKKTDLVIDSPTINGMEMQSKLTTLPPNKKDTTITTTVTPTVKTSVHVTALDGIVNVNSLFTMAIFIGFSLTVPRAATAATQSSCHASQGIVRRLIVLEVISFSCFLFSSLMAQSIKLSINLLNSMNPKEALKADIDPKLLKYGLFASAIGSVVGCMFLMLSIADFIQVKLGVFSCGGGAVYAVVALGVLVGSGLVVYVITAVYAAFFVEISTKDES